MEGFLSSSLSEKVALRFTKNYSYNSLIEIEVRKEDLGGNLDWGFADIQKFSSLNEKEVLFNPINMFRVQGVSEKQ